MPVLKPKLNSQTMTAVIIGLSLIISSAIGSFVFYEVRSTGNNLSVTGSAKTQVISDQVKWTSNFTRIVKLSNLKWGYDKMSQDLVLVKTFMNKQGIDDKDMIIGPVSMEQIYDYNQNSPTSEKEYTLRQTITVNNSDVNKIAGIAKNIQSVINQGVIFSTVSLEYYYSKLPELRVSLLSDAVKDAKARASKLAESTGRKVGTLSSASSGVVQVLPLNSVEVSDYGSYDTSSIEKEIMVSVRASFNIK